MLVPRVSAHIDPLPPIGRQAPAPAAVIVAGIDERCSEEEAMVVPEEGMAADEGPAVPAGASEARPDRRMRETCTAKARAAETGAAHAAAAHPTEPPGVHPPPTEMPPTAESAMTATATATASGKHR